MFILVYCEGILKYVYRPENYYFYLNFSSVKVHKDIFKKSYLFKTLLEVTRKLYIFPLSFKNREVDQDFSGSRFSGIFQKFRGTLKLKHYLNGLITVLKNELDFLS
jgi:hypothetical protein